MIAALSDSAHKQQQARFAADRELRIRVAASNYGRDSGWHVESDGQPVATLSDPQWDDMFWVSYAYSPTNDVAAAVRPQLDSTEFWLRDDLIYRSREFDMVAPFAFAAGAGPQTGRISIRGLYFSPVLTLYDRLLLWWRRHNSR